MPDVVNLPQERCTCLGRDRTVWRMSLSGIMCDFLPDAILVHLASDFQPHDVAHGLRPVARADRRAGGPLLLTSSCGSKFWTASPPPLLNSRTGVLGKVLMRLCAPTRRRRAFTCTS